MQVNTETAFGLRDEIMSILATMKGSNINYSLAMYLDSHYNWLLHLDSNEPLYDPKNRERVIELKNFLKYPENHLEAFIEYMSEYMDIKRSFRRDYYDDNDGEYHTIDEFFSETVSKLEECLHIIYTKMKENTVKKQLILNYLLDNKCCYDMRDEVKKYIFVDAISLEDLLFN